MSFKDVMDEGGNTNPIVGEDALEIYTPLERPVDVKAVLQKTRNFVIEEGLDLPNDSDSDSDAEGGRPKAKHAKGGLRGEVDKPVAAADDGGGTTFRVMANAYQEERHTNVMKGKPKTNNVWGNFIQEENLNSEMTGTLGVGKSLKDVYSDRGAETYDYTLAYKEREVKRRKMKKGKEKKNKEKIMKSSTLDDEMNSYWNNNERNAHASEMDIVKEEDKDDKVKTKDEPKEKRGMKRNVKERLGDKRVKMDMYNNEVLSLPGQPRQIPDIAEESLVEGTDEEFGKELSERLHEEKDDMIISLVKLLGRRVVLHFFKETQKVEMNGGMVIDNGARRRTAGGVMLYLMKQTEDEAIEGKIKNFVSEFNKKENDQRRKVAIANRWKKKKTLKDKDKEKANAMEDGIDEGDVSTRENHSGEDAELKSLPDILSAIANSFDGNNTIASTSITCDSSFKEPKAPPNNHEKVDG